MIAYSFNRELQYRVNFFVIMIGYLLYMAANVCFFGVLYNWTDSIGGWSYYEILMFLGTYHTIHGLWDFSTALNIERITEYVANGELDTILIKPVNSLYYIAFRNMNFAPLINVILGMGVVFVSMSKLNITFSIVNLVIFVYMILCGVVIFTMLQLILQLISFWVIRSNVVNELFYQVIQFAEKPDAIYRGMLRRVLIYIIPMIVVVNFPCRFMLGKGVEYVLWDSLVTFIILLVGITGWNMSVKRYSSASS